VVTKPNFVGYETDINALQDLALGDGVRLDAVITAQPTGAGAIKNGLPLKQLGEPIFFEYLAAAFDKSATLDTIPLAKKVSEIIQKMHSDGTLLQLSQKYYGMDLTTAAGKFDLTTLNQWK
jgi:polar amino acid transport system substrate-binding protein